MISYTDKDTHEGNISYSNNPNASYGNLTRPSWNYTIIYSDGDALIHDRSEAGGVRNTDDNKNCTTSHRQDDEPALGRELLIFPSFLSFLFLLRAKEMELIERINSLGKEIKVLKGEIKSILVDLRESMNLLGNPFASIEHLKAMSGKGGNRRRKMEIFGRFD